MTNRLFACLDDVQASVDALASVLAQPSLVSELPAASAALNLQAFKLSALVEQASVATKKDAFLIQRLRRTAAALASCQSHMARHAALAGQALQTLLPTARADTYASAMPGRQGQPYGSAGRQSGEFRVVSA